MSGSIRSHGRARPEPMRHPSCLCGARGVRSDEFDAYFCPASGVWLEPQCTEAGCVFCTRRPVAMKATRMNRTGPSHPLFFKLRFTRSGRLWEVEWLAITGVCGQGRTKTEAYLHLLDTMAACILAAKAAISHKAQVRHRRALLKEIGAKPLTRAEQAKLLAEIWGTAK